jgi:hypothetical protein
MPALALITAGAAIFWFVGSLVRASKQKSVTATEHVKAIATILKCADLSALKNEWDTAASKKIALRNWWCAPYTILQSDPAFNLTDQP